MKVIVKAKVTMIATAMKINDFKYNKTKIIFKKDKNRKVKTNIDSNNYI